MTTHTHPTARTLAVLAGLVLFATACTAGSDSTTDTPRAGAVDDGATADPDRTSSDPDDDATEAWTSPLATYFGAEASAEDEERFQVQQQRHDELVRDCMAEEGFTWEPATDLDGPRLDEGPWGLPRDEFVERYGYGMSTIDHEDRGVFEDPNADMLEAMSAPEREAWERALYGESYEYRGTGEPMPARDDVELSDLGCSGQASEEVWGSDVDEDVFAEFDGLVEDLGALHERTEDDPRVQEANAAWSDCMADAGYPDLQVPGDARDLVSTRLDDAIREGAGGEQASEGPRQALGARGMRDLEAADPDVLQELRDLELAIAAADHDCATAVDLERIRRAVQTEVEDDFIEQHRDELDAYRDMLAGSGGVG